MSEPAIRAFFDEPTNTVSYLVWDPDSRRGAIIDPVLDFDLASGAVADRSIGLLLAAADEAGVTVEWSLETHVHADHLTGAALVKARCGAKTAIGEHVAAVQDEFCDRFGADDVRPDGGDFDQLLGDGDTLPLGTLTIEVLHTPGHTPVDVSYRIGDAVFVGDSLFMPDYGTARTDFPGGDARALYRSIRKLLALPGETRLFKCHDYKAPGRDTFAWESRVAEQRAANKHVRDGIGEDEFVAMREARDATLSVPKLLVPSLQVNLRGGRFPPADDKGDRYLRLPVTFDGSDASALP